MLFSTEPPEAAERKRSAKDASIDEFRHPDKFRAGLLECLEGLLNVALRYASGAHECSIAGEAHLWLEAGAHQRLVALRANMLAVVENANICSRRKAVQPRLVKS